MQNSNWQRQSQTSYTSSYSDKLRNEYWQGKNFPTCWYSNRDENRWRGESDRWRRTVSARHFRRRSLTRVHALYNRIRSTDNSACTRIALFAPFQVQLVRLPIVKFKRQIARGRCPPRYRNRSSKPRILHFRDLAPQRLHKFSPRYDYDSRGERSKFMIYPWGRSI